jgi:IclR family acetate operon transcriptional repressor
MKAQPTAPAGGSLWRGLAVLRLLIEHGSLRADVIATELKLPLSSVYRYVRTLRDFGLLVEDDHEYRPGPVIDASPWAGVTRAKLVALATPIMNALVEVSGETAVLLVRVGTYAICLHQVHPPHHVRVGLRVGEPLPLYAGAASRALLAFSPDEVVEQVLSSELDPVTPNTPSRRALARQLESARRSLITTSRGELAPGYVAIGVPVFANGSAICALGLAGPDSRCNRAWQLHMKPLLLEAGKELSTLIDAQQIRPH